MLKTTNITLHITKGVKIKLLLATGLAIFIPVVLGGSYLFLYKHFETKIFPNVSVAGYPLGSKTRTEAERILASVTNNDKPLVLTSPEQSFELSPELLEIEYDINSVIDEAFALKNTGSVLAFLSSLYQTYQTQPELPLRYSLNNEKLTESLTVIAGQIATEPIYPSAKVVNGVVVVDKGRSGQDVNTEKLKNSIEEVLRFNKDRSLTITIENVDPSLNDEKAVAFQARAESLVGKSLTLKIELENHTFKDTEIIELLAPEGFSAQKVDLLATELVKNVERPVQNAVFRYEENKVEEFLPAKPGIAIEKSVLSALIFEQLGYLEKHEAKTLTVAIPVTTIEPAVTTKEVNNLGINKLIGSGESLYRGSISSRIHNINLAASRFNGIILEPGQVLSFNEILGDVSALTGYKQAYVIRDGKTVLGDGGGVCQVSTTLFRAALNAGLPITERRAHSYRVTYYEQGSSPGLDATVYAPTTDLKIKNDTPNHILIQTINDTKNAHLVFEIYGTSDGRVATITKPVVSAVTPPPDDLYIDDPTLPVGQIKQIDWKAWGAKASFNYTVERNGEVVYEKTFVSNFRPWQAKFLRGTGPAI